MAAFTSLLVLQAGFRPVVAGACLLRCSSEPPRLGETIEFSKRCLDSFDACIPGGCGCGD